MDHLKDFRAHDAVNKRRRWKMRMQLDHSHVYRVELTLHRDFFINHLSLWHLTWKIVMLDT